MVKARPQIVSAAARMALVGVLLYVITSPAQAPTGRQQILELAPPSKTELDAPDARRILEGQRRHLYQRAEQEKRYGELLGTPQGIEWLRAKAATEEAGADVDQLLSGMRAKYGCQLCELGWDMKWIAPKGAQFSKKAEAGQ